MKNAFKFGFLALAISLTAAACNSEKTADTADTTMVDSTMMSTDTMSMDTTVMDTMAMDTTKM